MSLIRTIFVSQSQRTLPIWIQQNWLFIIFAQTVWCNPPKDHVAGMKLWPLNTKPLSFAPQCLHLIPIQPVFPATVSTQHEIHETRTTWPTLSHNDFKFSSLKAEMVQIWALTVKWRGQQWVKDSWAKGSKEARGKLRSVNVERQQLQFAQHGSQLRFTVGVFSTRCKGLTTKLMRPMRVGCQLPG